MVVSTTLFHRDDRRLARQHGAPYRELLTAAPLWISQTPRIDHDGSQTWMAHAREDCQDLLVVAGVDGHRRLDPQMRFFNEKGRAKLWLCWCTESGDTAPAHPLRHLRTVVWAVNSTRGYMNSTTNSTVMIPGAEAQLWTLCQRVQTALADACTDPELRFWVDWLKMLAADVAGRLDDARMALASQVGLQLPKVGVLVSVETNWAMHRAASGLTGREQVLLAACPVQVRLTDTGRFVVRASHEHTAAVTSAMRGVAVLGPEQPMTTESWALYESLLEQYGVQDAYRIAAALAEHLDREMAEILRPLMAAGLPAGELIATALEVAS